MNPEKKCSVWQLSEQLVSCPSSLLAVLAACQLAEQLVSCPSSLLAVRAACQLSDQLVCWPSSLLAVRAACQLSGQLVNCLGCIGTWQRQLISCLDILLASKWAILCSCCCRCHSMNAVRALQLSLAAFYVFGFSITADQAARPSHLVAVWLAC